MEKIIEQTELKKLVDAVQFEKVIEAFKIMEVLRTCYPAGKIGDITDSLPGIGIRNDYPQTEKAFMFALGQLYQSQNSKVLDLFLEYLIKDYNSQYLRFKEMHDGTNDPYEKSTYYGLMTAYSNMAFDLAKKKSELG